MQLMTCRRRWGTWGSLEVRLEEVRIHDEGYEHARRVPSAALQRVTADEQTSRRSSGWVRMTTKSTWCLRTKRRGCASQQGVGSCPLKKQRDSVIYPRMKR